MSLLEKDAVKACIPGGIAEASSEPVPSDCVSLTGRVKKRQTQKMMHNIISKLFAFF
jgi:hypothetical protein